MVKILLINGVNIDGATGAAARLPPPLNNSKLGCTINTCWCTQIKNLGAPVHPRKKLVWSPAFEEGGHISVFIFLSLTQDLSCNCLFCFSSFNWFNPFLNIICIDLVYMTLVV